MKSAPLRTAAIVATGEELVSGRTVDTNSSWLQSRLRERGLRVVESRQVGDGLPDLEQALREAGSRAQVLLITGGLGPTEDDRTREALAKVLGVSLQRSAAAEDSLRAFFAALGRDPSSSNFRQADVPRGSELLSNERGTAPGILVRRDGGVWFSLPGVPAEMRWMWEHRVGPILDEWPRGEALVERSLRVVGLSESVVGERVAGFMGPDQRPTLAITAGRGQIRLTLSDDAGLEGSRRLELRAEELRALIGARHLLAEDEADLAEAVVRRMSAEGRTLAVAESCTGGMICSQLTGVPGSSAVLLEGCVTYSNEAKRRALGVPLELLERCGAVSEEVAVAMARGARERAGASEGIAVTGIAGPGGGSGDRPVGLVYGARATAEGVEHRRLRFAGSRDDVRRRTVATMLHWLLLGAPGGGGGPERT